MVMQYPVMLGGGDQHCTRSRRVQKPFGAAATRLDCLVPTDGRAHSLLKSVALIHLKTSAALNAFQHPDGRASHQIPHTD